MADQGRRSAWEVKLSGAAAKAISGSPALTDDDKRVILDWGRTVQKDGPEGLSKDATRVGKWQDHELSGVWAGFRASSFSSAGRLIYKVVDRIVLVIVVRVTTTHDYGGPTFEELKEVRGLEKRK